jgi:hypothetical protein
MFTLRGLPDRNRVQSSSKPARALSLCNECLTALVLPFPLLVFKTAKSSFTVCIHPWLASNSNKAPHLVAGVLPIPFSSWAFRRPHPASSFPGRFPVLQPPCSGIRWATRLQLCSERTPPFAPNRKASPFHKTGPARANIMLSTAMLPCLRHAQCWLDSAQWHSRAPAPPATP